MYMSCRVTNCHTMIRNVYLWCLTFYTISEYCQCISLELCLFLVCTYYFFFFFQAEDGIRDKLVTGVQTCALPISNRPHPGVGGGNRTLEGQIREDRYYAAHLMGELRDPRAIPILVPLLKDADINYKVPWALEQIGDKGAIGPLLDVLDDESPTMRVLAIYALETLHAKEALPRLILLLDDHRTSNFGSQVSVADAARAAIAKLQ